MSNTEDRTIELPYTVSRIGLHSKYKGKLFFSTSMSILGTVSGVIVGGDLLVLCPGSQVDATIHCDYLLVAGQVNGKMYAKKGIYLFPPAKVRGSIHSAIIRVQPGVDFEGECNLDNSDTIPKDTVNITRQEFRAYLIDCIARIEKDSKYVL